MLTKLMCICVSPQVPWHGARFSKCLSDHDIAPEKEDGASPSLAQVHSDYHYDQVLGPMREPYDNLAATPVISG